MPHSLKKKENLLLVLRKTVPITENIKINYKLKRKEIERYGFVELLNHQMLT